MRTKERDTSLRTQVLGRRSGSGEVPAAASERLGRLFTGERDLQHKQIGRASVPAGRQARRHQEGIARFHATGLVNMTHPSQAYAVVMMRGTGGAIGSSGLA